MRMICSGPIARFFGLSRLLALCGLSSCGTGSPRSFFSGELPAGSDGMRSRKRAGEGDRKGEAHRRDSWSEDERKEGEVCSTGERLESDESNESGLLGLSR